MRTIARRSGPSPRWASGSERLLYAALAVLAVMGLVTPGQFNVTPAGSLVEVAFLGSAVLAARRMGAGRLDGARCRPAATCSSRR